MRTALEPAEPDGMNMTPMIDVTFQLIIFFMLVTDMSNRQVEKMRMPAASKAIIDAQPALVIVNVRRDGVVAIDGKVFVRPGPDADTKRLDDFFALHAAMGKPVTVHLRADRSSEWQWVQLVMQSATAHGGAARMDFGAAIEPR